MFDISVYVQRRAALRRCWRRPASKDGLVVIIGNGTSPMNYADNAYPRSARITSFLYFLRCTGARIGGFPGPRIRAFHVIRGRSGFVRPGLDRPRPSVSDLAAQCRGGPCPAEVGPLRRAGRGRPPRVPCRPSTARMSATRSPRIGRDLSAEVGGQASVPPYPRGPVASGD